MLKEKIKITFFLFLGCFLMFSGCGKAEKNQYTVTYDFNYDNKIQTETVYIGIISEPEKPYRPGHNFDGWWYSDNGITRQWNFETDVVDKNITLIAHWQRITSTIYLNPNGGLCDVESVEVYYNEQYSLPIPTREGYYFAGWKSDGLDISEGIWLLTDDCRCTAKWTTYPPGMTINIGHFEQDGDLSNGSEDLEWYVVDYQNGKYFLVSKYILTSMRYSNEYKNWDWTSSLVREWLNGDFLTNSFSDYEKQYIIKTDLEENTEDHIFLLTRKDVEQSMRDFEMCIGIPTKYALMQGVKLMNIQGEYETTWYYLRGGQTADGLYFGIGSSKGAIRPAMWIDEEFLKQ